MTKIKYNNNNKNTIISNLNNCIDNLNVINNSFYNTYIPDDYYYKNTLANLMKDVRNIKDDVNNYKNDINRVMENINKNELELSSRINKINELNISKFNN